ncbi:MAG: hypothetical protein SGILL_007181, partial [Bacillariaceae sp.]
HDDGRSTHGSVAGSRSVISRKSAQSRASTRSGRSRMIQASNAGRRGLAPQNPGSRVMSVVLEGSNIAFCCYNEDSNEILTETCKASAFETESLVESFKQLARPTLLLFGTKIINNAPLVELLTQPVTLLPGDKDNDEQKEDQDEPVVATVSNINGDGTTSSSIPYRVMKSGSYDYQNCKACILQKLKVLSIMKDHAESSQGTDRQYIPDQQRRFQQPARGGPISYTPSSFHSLASVVDFDSTVLVKALGSLLSHLETTVFQLDGGIIRINRLVEAKTSERMVVSPLSFAALHIFAEETHPLIGKSQGNSKEGFSLYSLLDRTHSRGGRKLLRDWMLKPMVRVESINTRFDAVSLFLEPALQSAVGSTVSLLKKVGPVDSILARMSKFTASPKDLLLLHSSMLAAVSIGNVLRNDILGVMTSLTHLSTKRCLEYFTELLEDFNQEAIGNLITQVSNTVDEEATRNRDNTESVAIRYGIDPELDEMRFAYDDLESRLQQTGSFLHQQYPQLHGLNVVFLPQIGFLVGLMQEAIDHGQIELPSDFERIFQEDGAVYFKCGEMQVLDDDVGDLDADIADREHMIWTGLEESILDFQKELQECVRAASTLDCLLSFTECASDMGYTRPTIVDAKEDDSKNQVVYAKDARHPLVEVLRDREYIPNDIRLDEEGRVLVVTG